MADVSASVRRLILHGAAPIDGIAANFVASAALIGGQLLPVAASILHIARAEERTGVAHALALRLRRHFHIHMLLRHQHSRGLCGEIHNNGASTARGIALCLDAHLVSGEVSLYRLARLLQIHNLGGKICLGHDEAGCQHQGREA